MKQKEVLLEKVYNPKEFEERIYATWMDHGAFMPREGVGKPFVIVIPPPNVTGVLHMGHGLNNSLQDILIRYHRMKGEPTLWIPGTDHAGIATQSVVERKLWSQGVDPRSLGREKFVEITWQHALEHKKIIINQLKKIGASCDWSRERFTLDEGLSKAVREVFVSLYEKGLIYRGTYLVNWSPGLKTALADDEVEYREVQGRLYYILYPVADSDEKVMIATTRPETMLGDTAVAVHPGDERYRHLVGKEVIVPLVNRKVKVIADEYVDPEFGTGVVKITPAHDFNDFEIGRRHNLEFINIFNPDATLNEHVPEKYRGLSREEARARVVDDLKSLGLLVKEEPHVHQVGHCYRTHVPVEPYLSEQWFVRMDTMAQKALKAWEEGKIQFFPRKWENTYTHWLRNIRDWCISRQLWWGHRIPVWYCDDCGAQMVLREDPTACTSCGSTNIRQDEDVLDTWFSSWLWPFSTLGWPEETEDLKRFFPTTTLVTAYDIIFFWVARMIMASLEFMHEVPFRDIYITGLVRDKQGRKMSKSLGNGIDPLEIVNVYGADALRFTLAFLAAQGQDVLLDKDTFQVGAHFANKIWNASRFILMNLEGRRLIPFEKIEKTDIDRWILHRLNRAAAAVSDALETYRFNEAAQTAYEFFWSDFCDWYIESAKLSLNGDDEQEKDRIVSLLLFVLEQALKLLHPFLPFVTEELYQKLPTTEGLLILASFPEPRKEWEDPAAEASYTVLQEVVRGVRSLRSQFTIPPSVKFRVVVRCEDAGLLEYLRAHEALMKLLMNVEDLSIQQEPPLRAGAVVVVGKGFEVYSYVRDLIDVPKEIARLEKKIAKLQGVLDKVEKKLANPHFVEKAHPQVVEGERAKQRDLAEQIAKLREYEALLKG
ncbi:Valyl-tRNA synthetase [Spirochaeta thermophila DSM 6578]|uniref:Valine--tRNA ligase n=1 Tax=Winmispira thermophila (strain ATCC 700085 / DSM 6578 / Z-1203) TaxID=869211 RepID=G0GEN7_WINT7|nr:valine--tRNA ligase [Spirochaeta thermophila]AEJ60725.1 Valyl-tRNA synthetase [Spirochaeta thermophila DSM 6578]